MSSGNGRDYKLLVPFDVTHNVSVSTRYYKINDEIGAALNAAGQAIPVRFCFGLASESCQFEGCWRRQLTV